MEWLDKGVYRYEAQHPPLARVATAMGPYLAGSRPSGAADKAQEGVLILSRDHYDRNLALARLGILPFFWVAALVVYVWGRKYFGDLVAVAAVFLFTFLPPVLAHAGLATTDMALTAFVGASFLSGVVWLEKPGLLHSIVFGACVGIAVLSKFSSLVFLPAAFAAALVWHLWSQRPAASLVARQALQRILPFCLAAAVGAGMVWAGYRFSYGDYAGMRLPAPELFAGIQAVIEHNKQGHPAYLLGMHSRFGWWYYYPVVLAVKTPLPFLALLFAGAAICLRKAGRTNPATWLPLAFSLGILFFALFSQINIGVRHVLPVYMGFSIVAAVGAARLWEMSRTARWAAWTLGLLLVWHGATSALSHPDYIPYVNALAGSEPEKILAESDLDWGQDMKRLAKRLHEVGARQVAFNPFIVAYLEAVHGFPPIQPMDPEVPSPGWNAASITMIKAERLGLEDEHPEIKLWTEQIKPTERLGNTTLLWYFPPQTPSAPRR
jgi:4-amino-4-deoxy-L-arabinose transferase-like glycosyltransferase